MQYAAIVLAKSVHNFKIQAMTSVPDHCVAHDKPLGHISCNSSVLQITHITFSSLATYHQREHKIRTPRGSVGSLLLLS